MAFAAFHRFCCVIFSFSLIRYLWISSLILHWPNSCSLACCLGLPWCSIDRESACNAGDPGSIPGSGRSSGRGHGNTLQYSWASLVAQIIKNLPAMWETWVQSLGWKDPLEKKQLPTPVFWPGEFHGQRNLQATVHCHKELDTTERLLLSYILDKLL